MVLVAGMNYFTYTDDLGNDHVVRLDNNIGGQATTGFVAAARPTATTAFPQGLKMREVWGISGTGKRGKIKVATLGADLYTGVATTFKGSSADDGTQTTYTVTGRTGESFHPR